MNRQEFMKRLEELLADISQEERDEAITFYTGYFEDAGIENEEKVIRELESPEKLAASIRAGLRDPEGIYTENGYRQEEAADSTKTRNTGLTIVLIVLIAVVTSPVWLGLLSAVFGGLMGLFGILIGIVALLAGMVFAGLFGGIALLGAGIGVMVSGGFAAGMLIAGIGALLITVGLLCMILLVLFCGRFLPWVVRGIIHLFQKISGKSKKQAVA